MLARERESRQSLSPVLLSAFWGPSPMLDPVSGSDPSPFNGPAPLPSPHPGPLLTRVAVGTKVAMAAAALARAHAHFVLRARGVALAHRCGQEGPELPRALPPHCSLLSVSLPAAQVPRVPHSPTPHSSPCCLQPAQHAGSWELQAEKGLLSPSSKPQSLLGLPGSLLPTPPPRRWLWRPLEALGGTDGSSGDSQQRRLTPALRSRHWEAAEGTPLRDLTSKNFSAPSRRGLPSPFHQTPL